MAEFSDRLKNKKCFKGKIQYAETKSDIIAKADCTFVPCERQKRQEGKGKQKEQQDANQAGMGLNPAYSDAYGGATPCSVKELSEINSKSEYGNAAITEHAFNSKDLCGTTNLAFTNGVIVSVHVDSMFTDKTDHEYGADKYLDFKGKFPRIVGTKCGDNWACGKLAIAMRERVDHYDHVPIEAAVAFAFDILQTRSQDLQIEEEIRHRYLKVSTILSTVDAQGPKIFLVTLKNNQAGPIQILNDCAACGSGGGDAKEGFGTRFLNNYNAMTAQDCSVWGQVILAYASVVDPHTGSFIHSRTIDNAGILETTSLPLQTYLEHYNQFKMMEDKIYLNCLDSNDNPEGYKDSTVLLLRPKHGKLSHHDLLRYIRRMAASSVRSDFCWKELGDTGLELTSLTFVGDATTALQKRSDLFEVAETERGEHNLQERGSFKKPNKPRYKNCFNMQWMYEQSSNVFILLGKGEDFALRQKLLAAC